MIGNTRLFLACPVALASFTLLCKQATGADERRALPPRPNRQSAPKEYPHRRTGSMFNPTELKYTGPSDFAELECPFVDTPDNVGLNPASNPNPVQTVGGSSKYKNGKANTGIPPNTVQSVGVSSKYKNGKANNGIPPNTVQSVGVSSKYKNGKANNGIPPNTVQSIGVTSGTTKYKNGKAKGGRRERYLYTPTRGQRARALGETGADFLAAATHYEYRVVFTDGCFVTDINIDTNVEIRDSCNNLRTFTLDCTAMEKTSFIQSFALQKVSACETALFKCSTGPFGFTNYPETGDPDPTEETSVPDEPAPCDEETDHPQEPISDPNATPPTDSTEPFDGGDMDPEIDPMIPEVDFAPGDTTSGQEEAPADGALIGSVIRENPKGGRFSVGNP